MDVFLVNLTVYDDDIAGEKILRFAETPGFDPADALVDVYPPLLIDPGNFEEYLFEKNKTIGLSEAGKGKILLNNANGVLDGMRKYGYGRTIEHLRGSSTLANPSDFEVVFKGTTLGYIERTDTQISIDVNNALAEIYGQPYQTVQYSGDTTDTTYGANGHVNASSDDYAGKNRPIFWGNGGGKNMPVPLCNTGKQTLQVSQNAMRSITTVWLGGAVQTLDSAYTTLTALQAAVVASGHVAYYLGNNALDVDDPERGCYIRSGSAINGDITIEATEGWPNLLLYSEQLDNAAWTKSACTITADAVDAVDGTTTMDKVVENNANSTHYLYRDSTTVANKKYAISAFLKMGERYKGRLQLSNTAGTNGFYADFNLSDGGGVTAPVAIGSGTATSVEIQDCGSGIYRIGVVGIIDNSATTGRFALYLEDASGTVSYAGDNASGLYAWGMQLEQAAQVGPYVVTAGSVDYNDSLVNSIARAIQYKSVTPDWASFAALNNKFNAKGGIWIDTGENNTGEIIEKMLQGFNGYLIGDDVSGHFKIGRLEDPADGTSVATITQDLLEGDEKMERLSSDDENGDIPASKIIYNFNHNYLVQSETDLPGAATQAQKEYAKNEWRTVPNILADAAVITKHPKAVPFTINSYITDSTAAATEADRQKDLRTVEREFAAITLHEKYVRALRLGDIITVEYNRYSDTGSDKWLIVGKIYEYAENTGSLILWK